MTNVNDTRGRTTKWIRRIARIWSAPIIIYSLMMLAGYTWNWVTIGKADPYAVEGYPPIEALPPILMFLSVLGLGIAWSWERLGGTITLVFNLATLLVLLIQRPITQDFFQDFSAIPYLMSIVVVIPGILFLVSWWRSRKVPNIKNSA
jgi:hypothetical protein